MSKTNPANKKLVKILRLPSPKNKTVDLSIKKNSDASLKQNNNICNNFNNLDDEDDEYAFLNSERKKNY